VPPCRYVFAGFPAGAGFTSMDFAASGYSMDGDRGLHGGDDEFPLRLALLHHHGVTADVQHRPGDLVDLRRRERDRGHGAGALRLRRD
jgi:hypothetical protein